MNVAVVAALLAGLAPGSVAAQDRPAGQAVPSAPAREVRLALVVGEADYAAGILPTGANDAGLVAGALAGAGFDVTARVDVDAATLRTLVRDFTDRVDKAGPGAFAVVYLAGYGLQDGNADFVIPVDARIEREADVPAQAVALGDLFHPLELMPAKARLLIADLAHRTPFAPAGGGGAVSGAKDPAKNVGKDPAKDGFGPIAPLAPGLAPIQPLPGTVYAFNAVPGTLAAADALPYGAYARALAEMVATPGLPLATLLDRVRLRAGVLTNGADVPWNAGTADPTLTFAPPLAPGTSDLGALASADTYSTAIERNTLLGYAAAAKAAAGDPQAPRLRAILAVTREADFWSDSAKADVPRAYWTYMRRYPRGPHLPDARRRLAALKAPLEPPPRFDLMTYDDVPAPTPEEAALVAEPPAARSPALLANPAWPPIPAPPTGLLPPPAAPFADALAPPPLVPAGVMPVPLPMPALPMPPLLMPLRPGRTGPGGAVAGRAGDPVRRITQPDVPAYGQVVAETRLDAAGPALALFSDGKPLCRVLAAAGPAGERTATEVDAAGAVISRITVVSHDGELTIVQTGPDGGTLTQAVSAPQPNGGRRTVLTDGRRAVLATLRSNAAGVVTSAMPSPGSRPNPAFKPAGPGQAPALAPSVVATAVVGQASVGQASVGQGIAGQGLAGQGSAVAASAASPPYTPAAPPPLPPVVFPATEPPPAAPAAAAPRPAPGRPAPVAAPPGAPEAAKPPAPEARKAEPPTPPSVPEPPRKDAPKPDKAAPERTRPERGRKEPARKAPGRQEGRKAAAARAAPAKPPAAGRRAKAPARQAARAREAPARRPPAVHLKKHR